MTTTVEHRFDEAAITRLRQEFSQVSTSQLADASGDLVTALRLPLRSRNGLPRVAGPAFPVTTDDDMLPCLQALAATPPGWILLLVNEQRPSEALAGDILTASALAQRLGGLVVDGAVRDLDDLAELPIPVFSTEVTLVSARTTRERAPHVPQTVRTGGVEVRPGDWLVGDADGFVVVPEDKVTAVLSAGRLLRAREDRLKQSIRDGAGTLAELTGLADFLAGTGELRFEV
ncbi:hypothetical protein GCM10018781_52110 [Kitasatospora indigofera]|uniref:Putative 4-hydroxy-4-methyl-2-oxoglutarate aldolase n=1 Tax=Kitasatospora indigofera TaxID=67307 RepID=A0A919L032_9ACTN|nr:RraA family protein [Kitasatospora indigofera]GHH77831.1 hypothetical protein GCM10018781_52110 [Kitasatospora indigofera]